MGGINDNYRSKKDVYRYKVMAFTYFYYKK